MSKPISDTLFCRKVSINEEGVHKCPTASCALCSSARDSNGTIGWIVRSDLLDDVEIVHFCVTCDNIVGFYDRQYLGCKHSNEEQLKITTKPADRSYDVCVDCWNHMTADVSARAADIARKMANATAAW